MSKRKSAGLEERPRSNGDHQVKSSRSKKQKQNGTDTQLGADITALNSLSTHEFHARYFEPQWHTPPAPHADLSPAYSIELLHSSDLREGTVLNCRDLVKSTSKHDYDSSTSMTWSDRRKKRELTDPDMWFLLVRTELPTSHVAQHDEKEHEEEEDEVLGFLSFMLTHDSTPCVPVLYIYELHLVERLRKAGLGKRLMQIADGVARKTGVVKTMLTCFFSNHKAYAFYKHLGYAKDPTSPEDRKTRHKMVKADLEIMGKAVES